MGYYCQSFGSKGAGFRYKVEGVSTNLDAVEDAKTNVRALCLSYCPANVAPGPNKWCMCRSSLVTGSLQCSAEGSREGIG